MITKPSSHGFFTITVIIFISAIINNGASSEFIYSEWAQFFRLLSLVELI